MLIVRSRATAVVLLVVAALYHLLAGAIVCAIGWLAAMYYLWGVRRVQVGLGGQFEDLAGAGAALILVAWGCVLLWILRRAGHAYAALISVPIWGGWRFAQDVVSALTHGSRARAGCCVHCGYDLRATPKVCPECGVPIYTK